LRKMPPSETTLQLLDCVCIVLGTSRQKLTQISAPRLQPPVIRWAFLEGKSDRAAEVRKQVISELKKIARDDQPEIPDHVIQAVNAECPVCTEK